MSVGSISSKCDTFFHHPHEPNSIGCAFLFTNGPHHALRFFSTHFLWLLRDFRVGYRRSGFIQSVGPPAHWLQPEVNLWLTCIIGFSSRLLRPAQCLAQHLVKHCFRIFLRFLWNLYDFFMLYRGWVPKSTHRTLVLSRSGTGPPMEPQFGPILVHPWHPELAETGTQPSPALTGVLYYGTVRYHLLFSSDVTRLEEKTKRAMKRASSRRVGA